MSRPQLLMIVVLMMVALLGAAFVSGGLGGPKQISGIAIAQMDIPANTFIVPDQLGAGAVDPKAYPANVLFQPGHLPGRIARMNIQKGTPITAGMLYGSTDGIAHVLPNGHRAMSVPVKQPSAELEIYKPGKRIDIIATVRHNNGYVRAGTILEDILLLAKDSSNQANQGQTNFIVAVDPKQAEKLVLAMGHGEVKVVLREEHDSQILDSEGVDLNDLIRGMAETQGDAKLLPEQFNPGSMELIRGTRRSTDYFEESTKAKGL